MFVNEPQRELSLIIAKQNNKYGTVSKSKIYVDQTKPDRSLHFLIYFNYYF